MPKAKTGIKQKKVGAHKTLFEPVACPVCLSTSYTVRYPGQFPDNLSEDFLSQIYRSSSDHTLFEQVVQCSECQTVYLSPRLNPKLIIDSYAGGEDASFIAQDEARLKTFEKALRRLARDHNIALSPDTKVLDIGCAGGAFLLAAENLGLEAIGIEPNRWMCEYARREHQLDARPGVLADHHFPDATFDLITLWDVIEHVPSPSAELKEIHRILKPGGVLVVNYPDYQSLPARLLGRKWPFWLSVHLTYYTPKTITKHLEQSGFAVETITPHWQTLQLGYVLQRMAPYVGVAQGLKSLAARLGLAGIPFTYWMGQTQVVARKVQA